MNFMNKIVVFAAHPDDELLGVGGTVRKLANEGKEIRGIILAEGLTSRNNCGSDTNKDQLIQLQDDARKAARIVGYDSLDFCGLPDNRMDKIELLDIIKIVNEYIEKYKPDTIFTHHHGDLNIDHRITSEAVLTACRPCSNNSVKRILSFETPSSSEWNYFYNEPFKPNVFFDITDTLEAKIQGMACYKTEIRNYPHPRSGEGLRSLAKLRGTNIGYNAAEAFMLLRASFD